jgi:hypothetical protein
MNNEQYDILMQGIEVWNKWRKENSTVEIDLYRANLYRADLSGANLSGADLSGASLSGANLYRANLSGANLYRANLYRADLSGADLSNTCLDPLAKANEEDVLEWCRKFGIEIKSDGTIYAYRTKTSQVVGSTIYTKGIHTAPYFSVDGDTECHPGIYFSSKRWLKNTYPDTKLVRIRTHVLACCSTGSKCRARWIEVLDD